VVAKAWHPSRSCQLRQETRAALGASVRSAVMHDATQGEHIARADGFRVMRIEPVQEPQKGCSVVGGASQHRLRNQADIDRDSGAPGDGFYKSLSPKRVGGGRAKSRSRCRPAMP